MKRIHENSDDTAGYGKRAGADVFNVNSLGESETEVDKSQFWPRSPEMPERNESLRTQTPPSVRSHEKTPIEKFVSPGTSTPCSTRKFKSGGLIVKDGGPRQS